ncbi:MAG: L-alanine-DL-glutamate epimerase [Bacteroidota bacterium]
MLQISKASLTYESEKLRKAFGFKGSAIHEIWQTIVGLSGPAGSFGLGLGVQSVLWSDAKVFTRHTEQQGNQLMLALSQYALQLIEGQSYSNPIHMMEQLLEPVWAYGKKLTQNTQLRKTFVLNALVPIDNAAWVLYARQNDKQNFDELIPQIYRPALAHRHQKVASIPALSYGASMASIKQLLEEGYFILKIKIGAPGDQAEMLAKDQAFLKQIHQTIDSVRTPHTPNGKIPYYFDANGRYESIEQMHHFLDFAEQIGALEQIVVLEEPFGERFSQSVASLTQRGPLLAADESAHTEQEAQIRIDQGYNCLALKPVAKTMSMSLKVAKLAHEQSIPCFCADLTVNPTLVDWNKNFAARLAPLPGLSLGLLENNGWQNYQDWERLMSYHPKPKAHWLRPTGGVFATDQTFYAQSGGILQDSLYYQTKFKR